MIPITLRKEILAQLHTGHQGITKCRERARQSVWWPNIGKQLEDLIQHCPVCCQERLQPVEPLNASEFPSLPWETVAADLFYWKGSTYLLVVDLSLQIHRDCTPCHGEFHRSHQTAEDPLCLPWDSLQCCLRHWSTVCFQTVCQVRTAFATRPIDTHKEMVKLNES